VNVYNLYWSINIHNNLWQFLFNLIGKINRDGYSSLQLRANVQLGQSFTKC
jgi:hypothetical protein